MLHPVSLQAAGRGPQRRPAPGRVPGLGLGQVASCSLGMSEHLAHEVDFTILVGHGRTGSQFSSYWVLSLVCQVGLLWSGVLTSNGVASTAGENTGFWSQGCCVGASTEGVGASESPSSPMHFPALWLTSCVLLAKLFDLSVPVSSFVKSE